MKSQSASSSSMIAYANAFSNARFDPFFSGRYISAMRADSMTRGSHTMRSAPRSFAFTMRRATIGWLAAGL